VVVLEAVEEEGTINNKTAIIARPLYSDCIDSFVYLHQFSGKETSD
jgi:hypothetical protein